MKLLKEGLLSDYETLYPNRDCIFEQDGAPSHTSKATQSYRQFVKKKEATLIIYLSSDFQCIGIVIFSTCF